MLKNLDLAHRSGADARPLRPLEIAHLVRGRSVDTLTVGTHIFGLQAVQPDGLRAVILNHHQHRQNAIFIRVELSKSGFGLIRRVERVYAYGHLAVSLMMLV